MSLLKGREQLHQFLHREIHKIWKGRKKYNQESQGRDPDRRKRGGLKVESGRMYSIKGIIRIITMIIKEKNRDTKEWIIITISIKGENMITGRIKICLIDKDKEKSSTSIKTGIL